MCGSERSVCGGEGSVGEECVCVGGGECLHVTLLTRMNKVTPRDQTSAAEGS